MESRRLQRTSSHSRKEGMGDHRLKWLRADIVREPPLPATLRKRKAGWAEYRLTAPADYNSELSQEELNQLIKNARQIWADAHRDWTPEGDAEFQARRKTPTSSPGAAKKQKLDTAEKAGKQNSLASSQDDADAATAAAAEAEAEAEAEANRAPPDSPARRSVPSAPKGFGELKDLMLSGASHVAPRRRVARSGN